MIRKRIVLFMI